MSIARCLSIVVVSLFAASMLYGGDAPVGEGIASGTVFNDLNGNGKHDDGEPGLEGIAVSNQKEIVQTDAEGNWALPHDEDTAFFVIKPSGWATPLNKYNLPQFYYLHKPAGSRGIRYKGIDPTGPLPKSIDFALSKQEEPEQFKAILFGDPQPSNQDQVDYIAHDVIAELIGTDAKFGVTLGDIMFDRLETVRAIERQRRPDRHPVV